MSTSKAMSMAGGKDAQAASFERLAGACAIAVGVVNFLYAVAFVIITPSNPQLGKLLSALFLLAGNLLVTIVIVALYQRLQSVYPAFALWALLMGLAGALGAALHGGYDLGNGHQPAPPRRGAHGQPLYPAQSS